MENLEEIIEAVLFAAGVPVTKSDILVKMPDDVTRKDIDAAIENLKEKYSGNNGIILRVFKDSLQFETNNSYAQFVEEILRPVKDRELSSSIMEVLSIIAYFQPISRISIEEYRENKSADYAIGALLRTDLIQVSGVGDTKGRPNLYSTTDNFLRKFQLNSIDELPNLQEVKKQMYELGKYNTPTAGLYRADGDLPEVIEDDKEDELNAAQEQQMQEALNDVEIPDEYEIPDFVKESGSFEVIGEDLSEEEKSELAAAELVESDDEEPSVDENAGDGEEITV